MKHKLISQFLDEIKILYPNNITYIDYDCKSIKGPVLIINFENSTYELEISSLHYTDSDGDVIIEQCKKVFLQYRRQHNLEKLV